MTAELPPRVSVEGLVREFPQRGGAPLRVLNEVSFTVEAGEFVSVIGPSGCGKSTLFSILAGLDRATAGSILIDGNPLTTGQNHAAYMPQKDLLFPWRTVAANAALGLEVQGVPRREARRRVREWFPRFGLAGFEDARPFELSGGMRGRAALLRTVVQQRRTLLLDEPFAALDALTKQELHGWVQEVWLEHQWTALLITHDVREAILLSDRIVVLSPRPASVRCIVDVPLPKPRGIHTLADPRFVAIEREVFAALGE